MQFQLSDDNGQAVGDTRSLMTKIQEVFIQLRVSNQPAYRQARNRVRHAQRFRGRKSHLLFYHS